MNFLDFFSKRKWQGSLLLMALLSLQLHEASGQCTSVILNTQAEVDAFDCTVFDGDLIIDGPGITNLDALNELQEVTGDLVIRSTGVIEMNGFLALTTVGEDLEIEQNFQLASIGGFPVLQTVLEDLSIVENVSLVSISGFASLTTVGTAPVDEDDENNLEIWRNNSLESISGFASLTTLGASDVATDLDIIENPRLTSITGFGLLNFIGDDLNIEDNAALTSIDGFNALVTVREGIDITGNNSLHSITGLNGLMTLVDNLKIEDNPSLFSLGGFASLPAIGADFRVKHNPALYEFTGFPNLADVTENVEFEGNGYINSFSALQSLATVGGDFSLKNNNGLPSLPAFNSLTSVGGTLAIRDNSYMGAFDSFNNLTSIQGGLEVVNNNITGSMGGFTGLTEVGDDINISKNTQLAGIPAFDNLTMVGNIHISENNSLENISGFNSLSGATVISFYANPFLYSLGGFAGLGSVGDIFIESNSYLQSITAFANLAPHGVQNRVEVFDNFSLSDCCIFYDLVVGGAATLADNAQGCNSNAQITTNTVTAVCRESIQVDLDENGYAEITPAMVDDGSFGTCGVANMVLDRTTFDCLDAYSTFFPGSPEPTVTLTVSDGNGVSDDCETTVEVIDEQGPELVCLPSFEVELDENGEAELSFPFIVAVIDQENTFDNCLAQFQGFETGEGPSPYSLGINGGSPTSFNCADLGSGATVTVFLHDYVSDQNSECDVQITVTESMAPAVDCSGSPDVLLNPDGTLTLDVVEHELLRDPVIDNCTPTEDLVYQVSPATVDCGDVWEVVGPIPMTITITDASGNSTVCNKTLNVLEYEKPFLTGSQISVGLELDENGEATLTAGHLAGLVEDICTAFGDLEILFSEEEVSIDFDCSDITGPEPEEVDVAITDLSGNTLQTTVLYTVEDKLAPTVSCQDLTVYLDSNGGVNVCAEAFDNGSTDNCSTSLDFSFASNGTACMTMGCWMTGTNTVEVLVKDEYSNTSSCTPKLTVIDTFPPHTIPMGFTYNFTANVFLDANGNGQISTSDINQVFSDNCGSPNEMSYYFNGGSTTYPLDCSHLGASPLAVSFYVEDLNGNVTIETILVTISDNIPPSIECRDITVDLSPQGTATISHTDVLAEVTDNCDVGELTFELEETELNCYFVGENVFTLTATDANGVTTECETTVTVNPLVAINDIIVNDETCEGVADGSLNILASGPGQIMYSIDGGDTWNLVGFFQNLDPAGYDVKVRLQGAPGCEDSGYAEILEGDELTTWYKDIDGDGYSDGVSMTACAQLTGYEDEVHLIATSGDCNDYDATEHPGQVWYEDLDGDGHGTGIPFTGCSRPAGCFLSAELVNVDGDCDDDDATIHPGAAEICNGIDDDCDGEIDEDTSGGLTWNGNVTFSNQLQVDNFSQCYSVINGNLYIKNSGVNDLSNLVNLTEVTGYVYIKSTGLTSLVGLENLTTVGNYLRVMYNNSLTTLDGLEGVISVGGELKIYRNNNLTDCCAIHGLIENGGVGGSITISRNDTGCDNVSQIEMACAGGSQLIAPPSFDVLGSTDGEAFEMSVFPNPNNGVFQVKITGALEGANLRMLDATGQVKWEKEVTEGDGTQSVNLEWLVRGIYFLQYIDGGKSWTEKVIVR